MIELIGVGAFDMVTWPTRLKRMTRKNIYEAKTRLSQLVEEAASGKDVAIARAA